MTATLQELLDQRRALEDQLSAIHEAINAHPDKIAEYLRSGDAPVPDAALLRLIEQIAWLAPVDLKNDDEAYDFQFHDDLATIWQFKYEMGTLLNTNPFVGVHNGNGCADDELYVKEAIDWDIAQLEDDAEWWAAVSVKPRHEQVGYLLLTEYI